MIVPAVFPLMLVRMLMLVVVFMSVRRLVVRVLMCMSMSVFVLMLVAMIVLTFHWISSRYSLKTSNENRHAPRGQAPGKTDNTDDPASFLPSPAPEHGS
jgi:hypothetical protein